MAGNTRRRSRPTPVAIEVEPPNRQQSTRTENALVVDVPSRCLRVYRWQTGNRAWDIANCSRLVALALDEEGLHLLVLQDLHGRLLESERVRSSSGITACSNYSFTMF